MEKKNNIKLQLYLGVFALCFGSFHLGKMMQEKENGAIIEIVDEKMNTIMDNSLSDDAKKDFTFYTKIMRLMEDTYSSNDKKNKSEIEKIANDFFAVYEDYQDGLLKGYLLGQENVIAQLGEINEIQYLGLLDPVDVTKTLYFPIDELLVVKDEEEFYIIKKEEFSPVLSEECIDMLTNDKIGKSIQPKEVMLVKDYLLGIREVLSENIITKLEDNTNGVVMVNKYFFSNHLEEEATLKSNFIKLKHKSI